MILIEDKKNCCGCMTCYNSCPRQCIEMKEDGEGFRYPTIDKKKCINCGICKSICSSMNKRKNNYKTKVVAAWSKDEVNRKNSSSGGCFSEFAKYILKNNGIVYGAKYDKELNVIHESIKILEQLEKLKGSKYVQSDIRKTYQEAKKDLENDKLVLFSGTPCQVVGLYNYLSEDYPNLFTIDLICHGVFSPLVYESYLEYINKKNNNYEIQEIKFRSKIYGWGNYCMNITYSDGQKYIEKLDKDEFYQLYAKNMALRPSCYECRFCKTKREADITIGDYWGVEKHKPHLYDTKGVSLLFNNSIKARRGI